MLKNILVKIFFGFMPIITLFNFSNTSLMAYEISGDEKQAQEFIQSSANDFIQKLNEKLGDEQLKKAFQDILMKIFDFKAISQMTFGSAWRSASETEKNKIISIMPQVLDSIYFKNLRQFEGYKVEIKSTIMSGNIFNVKTVFKAPAGNENMVDWSVVKEGGRYLVTAVKIDGVDFAKTYLQSEFINDHSAEAIVKRMETIIKEKH